MMTVLSSAGRKPLAPALERRPRDTAVSTRVTIGSMQDRLGLTARALRHYESVGLLRVERDARNRRLYGREAADRLDVIIRLRRAGLGIAEIRLFLDQRERDPAAAEAHLQALLRRRVNALKAALSAAEEALEGLGAARSL